MTKSPVLYALACLAGVLCCQFSWAKEWIICGVTVNLADSMNVETDNERRLFGHVSEKSGSLPFLVIEIIPYTRFNEVLTEINVELEELGGRMHPVIKTSDFELFYYQDEIFLDEQTAHVHLQLVNSNRLSFYMAYIDSTDLRYDRDLVKNIAEQMLAGAKAGSDGCCHIEQGFCEH